MYFEGGEEAQVSSGAKLAFPVEYHKLERKPKYMEGHYYVWQVIWIACFVLFGLVLFVRDAGVFREAVTQSERYGACMGLGVLVFFGAPIAALIACVTVVGLFVGVSAFFLWYAGSVFRANDRGGNRRAMADGPHARDVAVDRADGGRSGDRAAGDDDSGTRRMDQVCGDFVGSGRDFPGVVPAIPAGHCSGLARGTVCAAVAPQYDNRRSAAGVN